MLPSEQFELAIYRWVKAVGIAGPVNIPDFYNMPGSNGEYALVVQRLKDLHALGYIALSKISGNYSAPYDKFVSMEGDNSFFGGGFVVEIAPGGRKFFEVLEAREEHEKRLKMDSESMIVEALRALDRGEKVDPIILQQLQDAGLVKTADVTHLQSRGQEFIFAGLTTKGLRLLESGNAQVGPAPAKDSQGSKAADSQAKQWDVFISHASEDKESIADRLAVALRDGGLKVWYDAFTLTLGDSLRASIDRGLAQSRFGVVILSAHFLRSIGRSKS